VAYIYGNLQFIFEDLPDTLKTQCCNGLYPADSNGEPQYSSDAAEWAVASELRGVEASTPEGTPGAQL
jgi:hypothetical protein